MSDIQAAAAQLLAHLQEHHDVTTKLAAKETRLLEELIKAVGLDEERAQEVDFAQLQPLLHELVACRLVGSIYAISPALALRVLQLLRLLLRNAVLRRQFLDLEGCKALVSACSAAAQAELIDGSAVAVPVQLDVVVEGVSIVRKLAADADGIAQLANAGAEELLQQLLSCPDPVLLPSVLLALARFAEHSELWARIATTATLDRLVDIVSLYHLEHGRLAATILALLSRHPVVVSQLVSINGIGRMLGRLQSGDWLLVQPLLRVVCHVASDAAAARDVYQVGGVPLLLAVLSNPSQLPSPGNGAAGGGMTADEIRYKCMLLTCTAIARLAEDDERGYHIRQRGGICVLGRLLQLPAQQPAGPSPPPATPTPTSSSSAAASEQAASGTPTAEATDALPATADPQRGTHAQGCSTSTSTDSTAPARVLHTYALRALRFLYGTERNRKLFKRLFPPDIFAAFIDIPHYTFELQPYGQLAVQLSQMGTHQRSAMAAALDDIDQSCLSNKRTVNGYVLLECVGQGAFGSVYKAKRLSGEQMFAVKELPLTGGALAEANGVTVAAAQQESGRMNKEVAILSGLRHPNIVQYYESFTVGSSLYIVMELVDGCSLLNRLHSLAERGRRMPEADVWQVLLAVILGLNYLHQRNIVHRDLTPNNIMLPQQQQQQQQQQQRCGSYCGDGAATQHAKIADFGLAKQLSGSLVRQSMVGTMAYTCPEMITQDRYTEKADVWSLGCVLYHMMSLRPPFSGSNPLTVASAIVEGKIEPIPEAEGEGSYSPQLRRLMQMMLTVDPNQRPAVPQLASMLAPQLMERLDALGEAHQRLQQLHDMATTHYGRSCSSCSSSSAAAPAATAGVDAVGPASSACAAAAAAVAQESRLSRDTSDVDARHATPEGAADSGTVPPTTSDGGTPAAGAPGDSSTDSIRAVRRQSSGRSRGGSSGGGGSTGGHRAAAAKAAKLASPAPKPGGTSKLAAKAAATAPTSAAAQASLRTVSSSKSSTVGGTSTGIRIDGGSSRVVTLPHSRLRAVGDPLLDMLELLHKVIWLDQLPPGLQRDQRRAVVSAFKRQLFGRDSSAAALKLHMVKLREAAAEWVPDVAGGAAYLNAPPGAAGAAGSTAPKDGALTYDQLKRVIEELLEAEGYRREVASDTAVG